MPVYRGTSNCDTDGQNDVIVCLSLDGMNEPTLPLLPALTQCVFVKAGVMQG